MNLSVSELTKTYGKRKVLDNFSFTFDCGIYGILGPNGAGKSTLMGLLTDTIKRETGKIMFQGKDIVELGKRYRRIIGYMAQNQGIYGGMNAVEYLRYIAYLKEIPSKEAKTQIDSLLETVHLEHEGNKKLREYSGGMLKRVMLAQTLLGAPQIVILDEPTAGLDPKERINIRNFISELSKDKIILFATHVVNDIECIADKVLLLNNGRLINNDTPSNLIKSVSEKVFEITCKKDEIKELQNKFSINNIMYKNDILKFRTVSDIMPDGFSVADDINLEDVYLYYFGHEK